MGGGKTWLSQRMRINRDSWILMGETIGGSESFGIRVSSQTVATRSSGIVDAGSGWSQRSIPRQAMQASLVYRTETWPINIPATSEPGSFRLFK